MAIKNDLKCNYDGVVIYATIIAIPTLITKCILALINSALIVAITIFTLSGITPGILIFLAIEIFVIKYTLWNLFGEERLFITTKSLSYQQHYGFMTNSLTTIPFNKKILIGTYDEVVENEQKLVKILFESYNENNLPDVIYQSVLNITEADFQKLIQLFDQQHLDETVESYAMPQINLN